MPERRARSSGSEAKASLPAGSILAQKYRIESVLGEGGMGTVYAAHHELLDQRVALKVLFAEAMLDPEARARFLQEARSAARLQSEHVARVMDIDTLDSGVPFIVMEYLEGSDLGQLLERRRVFEASRVVDYVLQALEAIAQAHAQGIIHRDLKPSNLFLTNRADGSQIIKVLDFGISKPTFGRVAKITSSRSVLGSPPYMSPEQVRSPRTVDARTDIWATGILLYELLTGKMPFDGEEVGELFAAILEQEPNGIRVKRRDVPEGLEHVVFRCLAKNRDERFSDVAELARALGPFGSGEQAKSVDRISATLLRAVERSSPRGRGLVSGITANADNATLPDDLGSAATDVGPPPELSPTASTVGTRLRQTLRGSGRTKTKIAAFLGGASAALIAIVVLLVFKRAPVPAAAALGPPPEPAVEAPLAPAATAPTSFAGSTPPAPPPAPPTPPPPLLFSPVPADVAAASAAEPKPAATAPTKPPTGSPPRTRAAPPVKAAVAAPPPKPAPAAPKPPPQDDLKKTLDLWNK